MTRTVPDEPIASRKVKVRVLCAVDPTGQWCAYGFTGQPEDGPTDIILECIADGEARYWLEAELDIPTPQTVQATVTKESAP